MRKVVAIMQPTYLPWTGYFNLISSSDTFVFLDDVQFEKQSWQNRNRIVHNNSALWLTVPLQKSKLSSLIKDIKISDSIQWKKKHIRSLSQSYAKAKFSDDMLDVIVPMLEKKSQFLVDLTIPIIREVLRNLGINRELVLSSQLQQGGGKSTKIINICRELESNNYLSPVGAKAYLDEDQSLFDKENIAIEFQDYTVEEYQQLGKGFMPYMSIVDVVANCGFDGAKRYVKSGGA